jgi:hypothetical protein
MTTTCDALGMTSIYRFRSLTNNLNFLNQSKYVKNYMWLLRLIYMVIYIRTIYAINSLQYSLPKKMLLSRLKAIWEEFFLFN